MTAVEVSHYTLSHLSLVPRPSARAIVTRDLGPPWLRTAGINITRGGEPGDEATAVWHCNLVLGGRGSPSRDHNSLAVHSLLAMALAKQPILELTDESSGQPLLHTQAR